MKKTLTAIGAAAAAMMSEKTEEQKHAEAVAERAPKVDAARALLTPDMIQRIANDEMPECFVIDRASYVAMAKITLQAVQLVDEVAGRVFAAHNASH